MVCTEIIAICSETLTKHIPEMSEKNVKFLSVKLTIRLLRVKQGSGKKWGEGNGLDRRTRGTTTDRKVTDHKNNKLALALHVEIFRFENVSLILQASFCFSLSMPSKGFSDQASLRNVALSQCFSTAGLRPGTGPWHQLHRASRGSSGICHFSFLSIFQE